MQVDGHSEAEPGPQGGTAYNGAAKWLGSTNGKSGSLASADLTYAYSWRWLTQPQGVWSEAEQARGWTFEPTERIREIFAGTARNKMRPWWATYTTSNYIATSRAPFNPMEYVFRTTGLIRGNHGYGFVLDDLHKDAGDHLYEWCGMLSGGVWEADLPDVPKGGLVLGYDHSKDAANVGMNTMAPYEASGHRSRILPLKGDPLLLVLPITPETSGDPSLPLIRVETARGPLDRKGVPQPYDRLVICSRANEGHFRILLIPFRMGEELPKITHASGSDEATLEWKGQKDLLKFRAESKSATSLTVTRDGKSAL